jgi:antitoxin component YwqK of YwqJK toxin-antitoxin module
MLHTEYYKDGASCECDEMQILRNVSTGGVYWETPYVNGRMHGISKWYYKSGALKSEDPYVNGEEHGIEKQYYESGRISALVEYKNGVLYRYEKYTEDQSGYEASLHFSDSRS